MDNIENYLASQLKKNIDTLKQINTKYGDESNDKNDNIRTESETVYSRN